MNFKKFLIAITIFAILPLTGNAQSGKMTDKQIMEYVIKENSKGTPQSAIVKNLIEKGVDISQIRRVRKNYEKELKKQQEKNGLNELDNKGDERSRKNNGDKRQEKTGKSTSMKRDEKQRPKRADYSWDYDDEVNQILEINEYDEDYFDNDEEYEEWLRWKEKTEKNPKIKVFGRDIFNKEKLTFEPDMNIATPSDYRLGPGDAVYVDVWGASQKNYTGTVSPDGNIDIEGFGPVQVSGMTVAQANNHLRSTLGSRYAGSNVRLTVGQTKTISINVMGAVKTPGTYTLSAFATVFHALYMAGGTDEIGSLRNISVFRNGKQITTVDVYDYILNGNLKGNVRLASGDVIIVNPYECLVNITGKVKRPMFYEMKKNESLGTLIGYAGGFTGDAYQKNVRLVRKNGNQYSVFSIDEFERNGFQLSDGDSVFVDSTLQRYSNMVEIKGAVFRPGMYQVDGNIATIRQLIENAGGFTEDAIRTRGILHRRKADRSLEVVALDLEGIHNHTAPDISLRNEDVLFIPSNKELKENQKLTITGEVLYPGDYEYAENTTVEDLILQAGGPTEATSLVKVDVSRRINNAKGSTAPETIAQTFSFELKEGFVVNGQPGFTLQPYDEVFVRRSPGYMEQEHVTITGEVTFTGKYVLTKRNYRLSDLIKAAGGLNKSAYAAGARLERLFTEDDKAKRESMLKAITGNDTIDNSLLDVIKTRPVGINLDKAIANPGNEQWDLVLQAGDKIVVPEISNTVSINGEVMLPNTVAYKEGAKLSYYINQAGGYTDKAKKSKVFIVNMNGTISRSNSSKSIQPGSEIVVPVKAEKRKLSFTEIISMGSLMGTLGAIIATLVK